MSEGSSARLALPLLRAGQAQKELWHNEALTALDLAVQASVVAVGRDLPPDGPGIGACWIVGDAPVGAWAGQAGNLAGWTVGGWRFVAPRDGWAVWNESDGEVVRYRSGGWIPGEVRARRVLIGGIPVIGAQGSAIADPAAGGGDAEARVVIAAILAALRGHGLIAG